MKMRLRAVLLAAALAALASSCGGGSDDPIRIGVLADCDGAVSGVYDVALAGAELPLLRRGATLASGRPADGVENVSVGGRRIELVLGCAGEQTAGAVELRRLVENEGAEIVVGPNWVPLGMVMTEYARYQPDVTFAVTSWEVLTHMNPGHNVFRFTLGYMQGSAGLGAYAYHDLGWRRAVTIAARDPLGFGFHAAPVVEFCALGGKIVDRIWLEVDSAAVPRQLSEIRTEDVDGFFFVAAGPEAGVFLEHLARTRRAVSRSVVFNAASLSGLDPAVVARLGEGLVGAVGGWDVPGMYLPSMAAYAKEYRRVYPRLADAADATFHLFDVYYQNAMEAVLQALEAVDGDLSDGQRAFRATLAAVELDAPNGPIRLDANRQAIGSVYLYQISSNDKGNLSVRPLRTIENVDSSFGGRFGPGDPLPDRTQPPCEHGNPPAWARKQ
jgi:branched-chain amino acid transport system substrate-binding protein